MLNKNTLGVKKCEANQKQHASRQMRPKVLISTEAKKLLYQKYFSLNNTYTIAYSIFFTIGFVTKRWPSDKANHEKYAISYCICVIQRRSIFDKVTFFTVTSPERSLQIPALLLRERSPRSLQYWWERCTHLYSWVDWSNESKVPCSRKQQ